MRPFALALPMLCLIPTACDRIEHIGQHPDHTSIALNEEARAMSVSGLPRDIQPERNVDRASLWSGNQQSLLGDRRAQKTGDILTVMIEIDDKAEFSNSSERGRSGSESMAVDSYLGVLEGQPFLQSGIAPNVGTSSSSASAGDGSIKRNEKLTLRVAATVIGQLPNGVLQIKGSQEVRVNYELRELLVTGYVRPADISRQNVIEYDKIASARISYGGRGQISDVQQPRIGQQVSDIILPF